MPGPAAPRVLILADDLSGAADCGVACAEAGLETLVLLDPEEAGYGAEALAVDLDSRRLPADGARTATRLAAHRLLAPGCLSYKKIDSTLRGNPGAEIAAAFEAVAGLHEHGTALAIVAPAFPAMGRTTRGGRVLVHGVPLERTETWRHEGNGANPDLAAMLGAAGLPTRAVSLQAVRAGGLADALRQAAADGTAALVCDAETDADLARIAAAGAALGTAVAWAGSGGLTRHLVPAAASGVARRRVRPATARRRGPVAVVVGSMSAISRAQVGVLARKPGTLAITVAPDVLAAVGSLGWAAAERSLDEALEAAGDGGIVVVSIGAGPMEEGAPGQLLCAALARLVASHVDARIGALVSTGGETARAVLGLAGAVGLRLVGEVEPGVPLGVAAGLAGPPLPVVTKAGAFGDEGTLVRCAEVLRALPSFAANADVGRRSGAVTRTGGRAMNVTKPLVAITMGDAAGVGPEVIMKSLAHTEVYERCRPLVVGDAARLRAAGEIAGGAATALEVRAVSEPEAGLYAPGTVDCLDLGLIPEGLPWGQLSPVAGDAAFQFIRVATELAMAGRVDAICTAPLNKEALHLGGHNFPGHTEMLAALTGTPEVSMMLMTPKLRVIHVTTHIGLLDAVERIEPGLVERTIDRGHETLVRAGIAAPRIGVCAINPHAGEHGLFGRGEEEAKIVPAVERCRARGWDVQGPLPADTLFFRAGRGDFDLVVAMYHDQGHGPVKVLGIEAGVNVTVGLPVVRTSVDHGTAFDIAGTGQADERSLLEALRQAVELAPRRDAGVEADIASPA